MKLASCLNQLLNMPNIGKLVLRISFSTMLLTHGLHKITTGISGITNMLAAKGLPLFFAYGVYIGEIVAPILIILGIFTRFSALVLSFNMVVAAFLVNASFWSFTSTGAWAVESIAVFFFSALAIALLGSGRFAIKPD